MATKKTTATKAVKKTAKKATKKVAAKKSTKKVAKKAVKKTTKKATAVTAELDLNSKSTPSHAELERAAYLNFLERLNNGQNGTPETDWEKALKDLA